MAWLDSIVLIHQRPDREKELEAEIAVLNKQIQELEDRVKQISNRYGVEVYYNNELVDLLRAHHIPFRQVLDNSYRRERMS